MTTTLHSTGDDATAIERWVQTGDTTTRLVRLSAREVTSFTSICHETPCPHLEKRIASEAHLCALLMELATRYFSRSNDGFVRRVVALNFNFAFKAPVCAGEDITLRWTVTQREWSIKLDGWIAHADGTVSSQCSGNALIGRATLLVKAEQAPSHVPEKCHGASVGAIAPAM